MSDIKVTQAEIDLLLNSADVQVRTEFGKCTVVTVRLRNGFILTESSACVDPANYDTELGKPDGHAGGGLGDRGGAAWII